MPARYLELVVAGFSPVRVVLPVVLSLAADLLPGDLEICLHVVVSPGSDNGPVIRPEIFDVPVDHIVNRFSGSVLRVCLEMDEPPLGLECRLLDGGRTWTRIDDATNILAVPVQHNRHLSAVVLTRTPIAEPRTFQWMTLLRQSGHGNDQTCQ